MRAGDRRLAAALCLVAAVVPACAGSTAPSGWLSPPWNARAEAFGGWIEVKHAEEGSKKARLRTQGELIAIVPDSLYVLTTKEGLRAVPTRSIERAKLTAYNSQHELLVTWTVLGTLSTASHGVGLILSAPVWIVSGTAASTSESRAPQLKSPPKTWKDLAQYARFPQGLPPALARETLEPKPRGK